MSTMTVDTVALPSSRRSGRPGKGKGGSMGDALEIRRKLASVRATSVVVATACAFEHTLHQVREKKTS